MTTAGYRLDRDWRGLTVREREVLSLAVNGLTQQEIAERLEISKQRAGQVTKALIDKGVVARMPDDKTIVTVEVRL